MAEPLWSDESFYKKELTRWNTTKREGGMRCNGFEMYPKMLYKARPHPMSGKYEVAVPQDILSLDKTSVLLNMEQFNASCQLIVENEEREEKAKRDGWRESQAEAMEYHEGEILRLATAAAERNYSDRNMSEASKREIAIAEASTPDHLGEIQEKRRASLAKARAAKAAKKVTTEPAV